MSQPNVLILMTDQQRFDSMGALGNPDVQTPHLDRLAAGSVIYENSFCPYPVCTPSRYSFLTSLYVRQHLGGGNYSTLPAGLPTFPRVLQESGYRTAGVGKMHFTPTYLDVGFDRLVLAEQNGPGRYEDDYHRWLEDRGLVDAVDLIDQERTYRSSASEAYWQTFGALPSNLDEANHSTTWIGERALEEIDGWSGGGNMLMVSFIKPHHPFDPPEPWNRLYNPQELTILPGWTEGMLPQDRAFRSGYFDYEDLDEPALRRVMAYYYGTISHIDHQVGKLLDRLGERGLYDDTLILFTSDHGEYLGFHHLLLKGNHLYEPLARVPLLIKYPGGYRAGERSNELVNSLDLGPTITRWAGAATPSSFSGQDLTDGISRTHIFAESGRGDEYMVRSHTHKLLLSNDPGQSLLFDLESDPWELENRIESESSRLQVEQMTHELLRWALFDHPAPVHLDEKAPSLRMPSSEESAQRRAQTARMMGLDLN